MVIAGYAGVGKNQFAERYPTESIDLVSMPNSQKDNASFHFIDDDDKQDTIPASSRQKLWL